MEQVPRFCQCGDPMFAFSRGLLHQSFPSIISGGRRGGGRRRSITSIENPSLATPDSTTGTTHATNPAWLRWSDTAIRIGANVHCRLNLGCGDGGSGGGAGAGWPEVLMSTTTSGDVQADDDVHAPPTTGRHGAGGGESTAALQHRSPELVGASKTSTRMHVPLSTSLARN